MNQDRLALLELITSYRLTQALYVVAELGLADLLSAGPRPCDELARAAEVDADALYRVMRALAAKQIFSEGDQRTFGLTPLGEGLCSDVRGSMRGWAIMVGGEHHWLPWGHLLECVRSGQPVFERVLGRPPFSYYAENPEAMFTFHSALGGQSEIVNDALLAAYDFTPFKTVVDIGGGNGSLLRGLLRRHPDMRGVIFDQAATIAEAESVIGEDRDVARRCELISGDFFDKVVPGGDVYLLKHVLHDWSDDESLQILRRCRAAMQPTARLLIIEMLIEPGSSNPYPAFLDLEMLVAYTGRERTADEYGTLLDESGFALEAVTATDAFVSVIEARPIV
ncbi:methyltransferase [Mycobacterium simiae]|uniref:Methyltransferase n=1 Tax=Mycobacterium simiae TaxID=1784 RepID=A0A5B1BMG9_MYCSI|nr:methyltransferase [Mycobacterium simiae]KAA1249948.1 methyltransferase [Mycobacterium simiae]